MRTPSATWSPARPRSAAGETRRVALWDLPLRLFHWGLVGAVTTAVITGQVGGEWMKVHGWAGIGIVGLLVFRTVWGLVGPQPARFASFAPTPARVVAYLRGRWQGLGHNPLGALSVFALLGLLAVQAATGLFANDDIAFTGPFAASIDDTWSARLTGWHHLVADALLWLIGLHVLAIVFYALARKHNLVGPMVTGWKDVPAEQAPAEPPRRAARWALGVALLLAVAAAVLASGVWRHAAPAPAAVQQQAHQHLQQQPPAAW